MGCAILTAKTETVSMEKHFKKLVNYKQSVNVFRI